MKAVEFLRVSTQEQSTDDRAGLPRQKEANAHTAKKHNLTVIKSFQIIDVSGTSVLHTPEVKELIGLMHSGQIQGVIVADWDRLIRLDNFNDFALLQHFKDTGTRIYLPDQVIDLNTQSGFLIGGFQSIISGNELTQIKKRMLAAKEVKRRKGEHPGSKISLPLGVGYDRQKKQFYYTDEIQKVKMLFNLFHAEGITNYNELQRLTGVHHRTIANLLRNQIYIGYRVYNEKRGPEKVIKPDGRQGDRKKVKRQPDEIIKVKVIEKPIIDEEVFFEVQETMKDKNRSYHATRSKRGERFLYSGFLRCGACGGKLYSTSGGKNHKKDYYLCRSKNYVWINRYGASKCPSHYLPREIVDHTVNSFISKALMDKGYTLRLIDSAASKQNLDQLELEASEVRRALKGLETKREKFLDLYGDGNFSKDEIDERISKLNDEVSLLRARLSKIEGSSALLSKTQVHDIIGPIIVTLAEYTFWNPTQKRSFLRSQLPEIFITNQGINEFSLRVSNPGDRVPADSSGTRRESASAPFSRFSATGPKSRVL